MAVLGRIEWSPELEITPFMEFVGRSHQFSFPAIEQERLNVSFNFFYTSNISVARDLLIKAGLFDEDFRDAVSPEIMENFYDSVLRYYYAAGLQIGLKELKGEDLDENTFIVPLDDFLERWSAEISDRLLRRLKHQTALTRSFSGKFENERRIREAEVGERDELLSQLHEKIRSLEQELKGHREFAEKVKSTLAYRIHKSLCSFRGKK